MNTNKRSYAISFFVMIAVGFGSFKKKMMQFVACTFLDLIPDLPKYIFTIAAKRMSL